ncbi:MAG: hypothetical protein GEV04_13000 [Actinophytocola sp.]|nr:hypothetical protein [Actinophytocola sp.]
MSGSDAGSSSGAPAAEPGPGTFAVELAEGFAGDDVSVLIDGRQMWHRNGVTTNYSVGIADVVRLPLPASAWPTVEVQVGRRSATQRVDVTGLGTSGGELRLRARIDPAGALTLGTASDEPRF